MWLYPDGSRVLELSTRAATSEAFQVAAEVRAFLADARASTSRASSRRRREGAGVLRGGAQERELSRRAGGRPAVGVADLRRELRVRRALASRELPPERVRRATSLYLLSLESDASVKVRDGLMDVKQLQRVDEDGLEQWQPVLKAEFPLAPPVSRRCSERSASAARSRATSTRSTSCSASVVDPSPDLLAVEVHKRRGTSRSAARWPSSPSSARRRAPRGRSRSSPWTRRS